MVFIAIGYSMGSIAVLNLNLVQGGSSSVEEGKGRFFSTMGNDAYGLCVCVLKC